MARRKTYPGSIEKRGGSYRVRLGVDGERHYFTLADVSREEAEQYARDKYKELQKRAERARVGLPTRLSVSQLFDRFEDEHLPGKAKKTQESYRGALKALRTFFVERLRDPNVGAVRAAHVRKYIAWRRLHDPDGERRRVKGDDGKLVDNPLSNRTVQLDCAVARIAFGTAVTDELIDVNPFAKVKPPKPDEREPIILSEDQYATLLEKATPNPMLHTYLVLLAETGVRCESEALWLRWDDVDFAEGFLHVESGRHGKRTKSGKGRWVPMTRALRERLREHFAAFRFAAPPSDWIFHHLVARRTAKAGDRLKSLRRSFEKAREAAGLPSHFTLHDLRHRRATLWAADKPVALVQEALGHADLATTQKYVHLARKHLKALVEDESDQKERMKELGS